MATANDDTLEFMEQLLADNEGAGAAEEPEPAIEPPRAATQVVYEKAAPAKLRKKEVLAALERHRETAACARALTAYTASELQTMKVAPLRELLFHMDALAAGTPADAPVEAAAMPAPPAETPKRGRRRAPRPAPEPEDFVVDEEPLDGGAEKGRIPLDNAKVSEFMAVATIEMARGAEALMAAYKPGGKCIDGYAERVAANRAELVKLMGEILETEDAPEFLKNITPTQRLVGLLGLTAVSSLKDAPPVAAPGTSSIPEQHRWDSLSSAQSHTAGS